MSDQFSVIIPAVIYSSSLSCPVTTEIDGEPLIVKVVAQTKDINANQVIVATDHQDIINLCNRFGITAVMTTFTHNTGTDRIVEVVKKLNIKDTIISLKADQLLLENKLIEKLVEYLSSHNLPVATIATEISNLDDLNNNNIVKVVANKNSMAMYFSRGNIPYCRSGLNIDYILKNKQSVNSNFQILRHIGVYAYSNQFISNYYNLDRSDIELLEDLEQLRVLYNGINMGVLVV